MTTNGQAPFITMFMYLNEVEDGQTRDDLALIIEEMLHQRNFKVLKMKRVFYITPAFPKLIYVLEENNVREGTKYWHLTKLAAECYSKTNGSGLHFRKNYERVKRRKLLYMHGMSFFLNGI